MTRPGEGTLTGRVWEIADALGETLEREPSRSEVVEKCVAEGLNVNTAHTQFSLWRKENTEAVPDAGPDHLPLELADEGTSPDRDWAILLKAGFGYVADIRPEGEDGIAFDRDLPDHGGVYAFVVEDVVHYVGVTLGSLRTRMRGYRYGHHGQRTNARLKALIRCELDAHPSVRLQFVDTRGDSWNDLLVALSHGLEIGLIAALEPRWNIRA